MILDIGELEWKFSYWSYIYKVSVFPSSPVRHPSFHPGSSSPHFTNVSAWLFLDKGFLFLDTCSKTSSEKYQHRASPHQWQSNLQGGALAYLHPNLLYLALMKAIRGFPPPPQQLVTMNRRETKVRDNHNCCAVKSSQVKLKAPNNSQPLLE